MQLYFDLLDLPPSFKLHRIGPNQSTVANDHGRWQFLLTINLIINKIKSIASERYKKMETGQSSGSQEILMKDDPRRRGPIDAIYTQIKTMMYNQELAPGQKLIYQDLAHRLNVSTTPILQALHRLENAKLVRYEHNKGFFVAEITETEARELYQAREALEVYLIPFLIKNLTEDHIKEIRDRKSVV